jgi:hypothetical protein
MPQPTPYDRQHSFANFSANNPVQPHNGTSIDQEFNAVKIAMDETQANLALIQDDDGALRRASVGQAQLDSSITLGFSDPRPWAADTDYTENVSTVWYQSKFYQATETHTSGVTFDDTKWFEIADLSVSAALDDGAVTEAKLANSAVTTNKIQSLAVTTAKIAADAVTEAKLSAALRVLILTTITYDTFAAAQAATPTSTTTTIRLRGYLAAGDDGRDTTWVYTASTPAHGCYLTTSNGRNYELKTIAIIPEHVGAVGDGTTDDSAAMVKWNAYDGCRTKKLLGKTYLIAQTLNLNPDYLYEGIPGKSKIKGKTVAAGASYTDDNMVLCAGATDPTALPGLNGALAPTQTYIELASSVAGYNLEAGDVIIVYNRVDESYSGHRAEYRAGEMHPITSYGAGSGANTRVFIADRILYAHAEADIDVYFFKKKGVTIRGIQFEAPSDAGVAALRLKLLTGVVLDDVAAMINTASVSTAGEFDRCYDIRGTLRGFALGANGSSTDQYGWVIANCTQGVFNSVVGSTWHPIAIGGYDGSSVGYLGGVPNRSIRFSGCQFWSSGTGAPGTDVHGNSEDIVFDACYIQNGAKFGGKDVTYNECRIQGGDFANGAVIYAAELRGGSFVFSDCILETHGNPAAISRGIVDIGGNGDAFGAAGKEEANVRIQNCTLNITSFATIIVKMSNYSTSYPINIEINGLVVQGGVSVSHLIRYEGAVVGVAKARFVSVQRIMGLKAGAILAVDAGTTPWDSTTEMTMPVQGGSVSLSTSNATSSTIEGAPVAFKWTYPAEPNSTFAMKGVPVNGKGILPVVHTRDATQIRHGIYSHDGANWAGTTAVVVSWQAGPKLIGFA